MHISLVFEMCRINQMLDNSDVGCTRCWINKVLDKPGVG